MYKSVREQNAMDTFKPHLDKFLAKIPDLPTVSGYSTQNNNSLLESEPVRT